MEIGEVTLGTEQPVEAYLDDEPSESRDADDDGSANPSSDEPAAEVPEPRRPAKKRGRASVPSWDEIMFGGGKND